MGVRVIALKCFVTRLKSPYWPLAKLEFIDHIRFMRACDESCFSSNILNLDKSLKYNFKLFF